MYNVNNLNKLFHHHITYLVSFQLRAKGYIIGKNEIAESYKIIILVLMLLDTVDNIDGVYCVAGSMALSCAQILNNHIDKL